MRDTTARGLTVADVARRYRVSPDRVRAWIARGELAAINTRDVRCGRPRWVVTAEALAAFERGRQAIPPAPPPKRKKTECSSRLLSGGQIDDAARLMSRACRDGRPD